MLNYDDMRRKVDVFLSFHNRDRDVVRLVAGSLRKKGIHAWMDEDELRPGLPWQDGLQDAISASKAAAVFLGQHGFGDWQRVEVRVLLDRMAHDGLAVIPILLPGSPAEPVLGDFLRQSTWVDFRNGITDAGLERLRWGITGKRRLKRASPRSGPPIHNLPFGTLGDLFKGRDGELARLSVDLEAGGSAVAIVQSRVISGLGGMGKTRLAVEHAWRSGHRYTAVWFVRADSPGSLRSSFAALAAPAFLDLPEDKARMEAEMVSAVLRALRERIGWLLIVDNVDTEDAAASVGELLPLLSNGRILITSRLEQWPAAVQTTPLATIAGGEAVAFLLERTAGKRSPVTSDPETAARLAELVDNLPLALEQAAAFIARHQMTFEDYLANWESEREAVLAWYDARVMQYPASVAVTWNRTFRQLSIPARALLRLAAFLAADPISQNLVENGEAQVLEAAAMLADESGGEVDRMPIREALAELAAYSMISRQVRKQFTVHRLVQEVLQNQTPASARCKWVELALNMVSDFAPEEPDEVLTWPTWEPLRPHAVAILRHAEACNIATPTGRLYNELGAFVFGKGLFEEAERLFRRGLELDEISFGPDSPSVGVRLHNLANLLNVLHRFAEAERYARRALVIGEKTHAADDPWIALLASSLSDLLRNKGPAHFEEAEALARRALAISEISVGENPSGVAFRLNNLAVLLEWMKREEEIEPMLRRSLSLHEVAYGPDHPHTATALGNLGRALSRAGRLTEAEPLLRRALAIDEVNFGQGHRKVAISLNQLGSLLRLMNRAAEAEPLLQRALEIMEEVLGPQHPDAQTIRANVDRLKTSRGADRGGG